MELREKGCRLLPLIMAMGGIFYMSHQPGDSFSLPDIVNIDKLLHALAYTVLGLTFLYALPLPWRQRYRVLAGSAAMLFCLFYGITDEFHQSFIPGRFASGADILADVSGGCLAAILHGRWQQWRVTKQM